MLKKAVTEYYGDRKTDGDETPRRWASVSITISKSIGDKNIQPEFFDKHFRLTFLSREDLRMVMVMLTAVHERVVLCF